MRRDHRRLPQQLFATKIRKKRLQLVKTQKNATKKHPCFDNFSHFVWYNKTCTTRAFWLGFEQNDQFAHKHRDFPQMDVQATQQNNESI